MVDAGPVLVTGAYGLIGHEVTLQLHARGTRVVAADRLGAVPEDSDITSVSLDINGIDAIMDVIREYRITSIVHAAGVSGPMLGRQAPHAVLHTNIGGTLDLFEAARRTGVRRIVVLSSASAYGATGEAPVTEASSLAANDVYGSSKIGGELIARAYAAHHGVEAVILRPCWVYGRRRRTACVLMTMIGDALAGRPTHLHYGRDFPRQFVHVGDVARACIRSLDGAGISGRAFNIADGARMTIDAVAARIASKLPSASITLEPGADPDDYLIGQLDISAAGRILGWQPQVTLDAGIDQLIEALKPVSPAEQVRQTATRDPNAMANPND